MHSPTKPMGHCLTSATPRAEAEPAASPSQKPQGFPTDQWLHHPSGSSPAPGSWTQSIPTTLPGGGPGLLQTLPPPGRSRPSSDRKNQGTETPQAPHLPAQLTQPGWRANRIPGLLPPLHQPAVKTLANTDSEHTASREASTSSGGKQGPCHQSLTI